MKGMTPTEAANLTAFMCGLPTSDLAWSLKQVNQLLFLRRMRQSGRFGDTDGAPPARTDHSPTSPVWTATLLPPSRSSARSGAEPPPGAASARQGPG